MSFQQNVSKTTSSLCGAHIVTLIEMSATAVPDVVNSWNQSDEATDVAATLCSHYSGWAQQSLIHSLCVCRHSVDESQSRMCFDGARGRLRCWKGIEDESRDVWCKERNGHHLWWRCALCWWFRFTDDAHHKIPAFWGVCSHWCSANYGENRVGAKSSSPASHDHWHRTYIQNTHTMFQSSTWYPAACIITYIKPLYVMLLFFVAYC